MFVVKYSCGTLQSALFLIPMNAYLLQYNKPVYLQSYAVK